MSDTENIQKLEEEMASYKGEDEVLSSADLKKIIDEKESGRTIVMPSGFPALDRMTEGGFEPGELIVISAFAKQGKTTFAQTITKNLEYRGYKSLWFTYEIPMRKFIAKYGDDIPNFYAPAKLAHANISWIEKKIVEAKIKHDIKCVFIDHLHYLVPMGQGNMNMSLLIGGVLRNLKKLSIKHEVAIFLICHTRKLKPDKKPSVDDIRDSSFTIQEPDYVIILWRLLQGKMADGIPEDIGGSTYGSKTKVMMGANRKNGDCGEFIIELKNNLFQQV